MIGRRVAAGVAMAIGAGCALPAGGGAAPAAEAACPAVFAGRPLPARLEETSGLARGRRNPALFWTHNDSGGDPELFAIDSAGRIAARVRVDGARATDWEDVEAGPCGSGHCLFAADIGDNAGRRGHVTIYEVPEPAPGDAAAAAARVVHARYPEGPRDAEGLFALPDGRLFVVTKGRQDDVTVYRIPPPAGPGDTVTMERVVRLHPHPPSFIDQATAATASPDGRWIAVRTYRTLYLYPARILAGGDDPSPLAVDLLPLAERQGEAVALDDDGTVWLTSEARGERPAWSRLACTLPPR